MMASLVRRVDEIARERQRTKVAAVAVALRSAFGERAVTTDGMRVLVDGRGLVKRWLTDPTLRFLAGGLK